jgi:betaine-aldehyde dehydrogenase
VRQHDHWIAGTHVMPYGDQRLIRFSPADGRELASVANGDASDVDAAVKAARRGFDSGEWRKLSGSLRGTVLGRFADIIEARIDEISQLEAEEAGKPITAARAEILYALDLIRYAASLAWNISGRLMTDAGTDGMGIVLQQPRGVVGIIVPWNYPVVALVQKLAFALAAGCSIVVKPSEYTAGTTLLLARYAQEAGIPDGQINVVIGDGACVGEALTSHPSIDMISFTGSSQVGARIAEKCAGSLKHYSLELGGKSANIVFEDADLAAAAEGVYIGFTINAGQECCAGTRILVQESVAPQFIDMLQERCKAAKIGQLLDKQTELGPVIHEQHLKRVMDFIAKGKSEGATVVTGGERIKEGALSLGLYVEPTLFTNVTADMSIYREEIFGPVACVSTFKTFDEAMTLANDTRYGLANGVWTSNLDRIMAALRELKSGLVWVNTYLHLIPQMPFGGMKDSGKGRENGIEGLQEFLETRSAYVRIASVS